ncbi:hypothetical protein WA026_000133 [Henosepilachna vigintioctopunctata]|uniref:Uncharacterized protein n=1 Tax=Henosepilachna vigintioctopunctata TaxID=420089 RepID=A0AAW1V376_9CUCU
MLPVLLSNRLSRRVQTQAMKYVLAILGLVVCTAAFQYSIPKYGKLYGYEDQEHKDDVLTELYNRFHGPYNTNAYQRRYGQQYQVKDDQDYQERHHYQAMKHGESEEVHLPNIRMAKYGFTDIYNKLKDYLKNQRDQDTPEILSEEHQDIEDEEINTKVNHDEHFAKKQQDVFQLLKYINNPIYDTKFQQVYSSFDLQKYSQYYEPEAFKAFAHYWENQMFLSRGEIFSIFNDVHVHQVKLLFRLFYTAKDYETFFKTAVFARQHFNEAMFLYTYSVAIIHREDTQGLILPPIYEIYPHYFFNSEVMHKAYQYKMGHFNKQHSNENGVYTIHSNYSGWYLNMNPEQSLSYYTEDVGINAFYYYFNVYFPYWMDAQDFHMTPKRGEVFYYVHQQLVARYYLERLSHGIGGIDNFNWEVPFETGYYPSLTYPNGLAFTERPNFANLQEYFSNYGQHWCFISKYGYGYTYINTYEQRIREVIDLGYFYTHDGNKVDLYTPEGFKVLGNIIEGNTASPNYRYYGSYVNFARHLLGYAKQPLDNYKLAPSALEHFETTMRDPAFYKLFKKITLLFQKYKVNLPAYTKKDLYLPGVKVEKIEIDPLVTFYDKFYSDITNGITVTPEEYQTDSFRVQVEQYRLNHRNFNFNIHINSDKAFKAVVKTFIGPKYDEHGRVMDFYENRMNFVELDQFVYNLKSGQNEIVRNSRHFVWFHKDSTSFFDIYKNIMTHNIESVQHTEELLLHYPQRLMLPRGTEKGLTYQMYVIVFPYVPYQGQETTNHFQHKYETVENKFNQFWMIQHENHPLGYPFDRPAEFEHVYFVPNAHMFDVKIYHKVLHNENVETKDYAETVPQYFM